MTFVGRDILGAPRPPVSLPLLGAVFCYTRVIVVVFVGVGLLVATVKTAKANSP